MQAAAAARLAASDSRRGARPGRVTACGIRRAIGFTGMTYLFLETAGVTGGDATAAISSSSFIASLLRSGGNRFAEAARISSPCPAGSSCTSARGSVYRVNAVAVRPGVD
jgi:hypothetical protein